MSKSTKVAAVATKSKSYASAYREGGSYHAIVVCLEKLGAVGKYVAADALLKLYPSVVGAEAWRAFRTKEARNEATAKDAAGRVIQNAIVICRPDQYGNPLRELGVECRKERDAAGYRFGLFKIAPLAPKAAKGSQSNSGASKAKATAKTAPKAAKAAAKGGKGKVANGVVQGKLIERKAAPAKAAKVASK